MTAMFEIKESPVYSSEGIIEGKKALMIDGKTINIVSENYHVVQPRDVMSRLESIPGLRTTTALSNPNTGGLLVAAKLDNRIDNFSYQHNLVFYTGHNGQYRTLLTNQSLRLACMNQCSTLLGQKERHLYSEKHYKEFDVEKMGEIIENVPRIAAEFERNMRDMEAEPLSLSRFVELYMDRQKVSDQRKDSVRLTLMDIYRNAKGQSVLPENTVAKAFNTITYLNTHNLKQGKNSLENKFITKINDSTNWYNELLRAA